MNLKKVAIIQRVMPHYRVAFFAKLSEVLNKQGIELAVYYGKENPGQVPKTVHVEAAWARQIENKYWKIAGYELVFQQCPKLMGVFDLVIIEHALRFPLNILLIIQRRFSSTALAFWGHGRNFQIGKANVISEAIKARLTRFVDWWFAYTELSIEAIASQGFPLDHVTVVNNAIDTSGFLKALHAADIEGTEELRRSMNLYSKHVGIFCGGMYSDKKLSFLIETIKIIRAQVQDFECILIGDGPDAHLVRDFAAKEPWVRYVGPIYGEDRAKYFRLSHVILMPGAVGLVAVDSFVAQIPLATTRNNSHGPELAYLINDYNGIITSNDVHAYAGALVEYFRDDEYQKILKLGCYKSAQEITLEKMVQRYSEGIRACLAER